MRPTERTTALYFSDLTAPGTTESQWKDLKAELSDHSRTTIFLLDFRSAAGRILPVSAATCSFRAALKCLQRLSRRTVSPTTPLVVSILLGWTRRKGFCWRCLPSSQQYPRYFLLNGLVGRWFIRFLARLLVFTRISLRVQLTDSRY